MNEDEGCLGPENARDAAINWWVRKREGPLSQREQAEFDAWLADDPQNAAAFDDISGMCADLASLRPARPAKKPASMPRRLRLAGAAVLAAASVALFAGFSDLSVFVRADHYAGVGETKLVTLADGSHVELDAKSAIAVHYGQSQRRLTLLQGEAWFEVAADPARPFVVEAAGGTVTARGTAFDVATENFGAQVTVLEHSVVVLSGGREVIVAAGERIVYASDSPAPLASPVDAARATAWRRGKLIVEDRPLGEVLATLGRYRHGFVYCVTSATCARRVTGVFGTGDPMQALREIDAFLGLHVTSLTNYLILLHE